MFKQEFGIEKYLLDLPFRLRIHVTKFRCRNSKLAIEIGSYNGIVRHERYCEMRVLGDKFHALFICPAFAQLRKNILENFGMKIMF